MNLSHVFTWIIFLNGSECYNRKPHGPVCEHSPACLCLLWILFIVDRVAVRHLVNKFQNARLRLRRFIILALYFLWIVTGDPRAPISALGHTVIFAVNGALMAGQWQNSAWSFLLHSFIHAEHEREWIASTDRFSSLRYDATGIRT